ncbi:HMG-Y-related protein A-like [Hibiscus syriacus]|uniref:HMG-Y-related protein A-like n=1 Tax=Hibiscus syriacus TaxID=106335 RepID=UPI001923DC51|nr:HMG-Y-related protein A-like [Hibiscus syriacus]
MDSFFSSIPVAPQPPIPPRPVVAPLFASNPQPPTTVAGGPPLSFDHPSYTDMICEAISGLKDANGSSKRAIAKYIESAHKDLPPTHSALLTHHLKRLKNNGILVMVKKSYKLASDATRSEVPIPDSTPPDASTGLNEAAVALLNPNPQSPLLPMKPFRLSNCRLRFPM